MFEKKLEEQLRLAVQCYHFAAPEKSSLELSELLKAQFDATKTEAWVRRWWKRDSPKTIVGQGRKEKFTEAEKKKVVKKSTGFKRLRDGSRRRHLSVREAAAEFKRDTDGDKTMSRETVRTLLKKDEKVYRHLGVQSLLRAIHLVARESLCDAVNTMTDDELLSVVFTDSTKFELQRYTNKRNDGSWVSPGEEMPSDTKVKHPVWFHVYGALTKYGLCGPYYVESGVSINASLYTTQILPAMLKDLKAKFGDEPFILQQDGAGAHFSKMATEFIESEDVAYWPKGFWPGSSADLSPIENVWEVLKRRVFDKGTPATPRIAKGRIGNFFPEYPADMCLKLVKSFAKRVKIELPQKNFGVTDH